MESLIHRIEEEYSEDNLSDSYFEGEESEDEVLSLAQIEEVPKPLPLKMEDIAEEVKSEEAKKKNMNENKISEARTPKQSTVK